MENRLKETIAILEQTRKEKKLSYEKIAVMINSSRANVWKCLTGQSMPTSETLYLLVDCLGYELPLMLKPCLKLIPSLDSTSSDKLRSNLLQGNWIENVEEGNLSNAFIEKNNQEQQKKVSSRKAKVKKVAEQIEKVEGLGKCPNCTYENLKSGISILLKKCDDCKTKKK